MKSWEELTPIQQAAETWYDLYKDVYGFRPRSIDTSNWTLDRFNAEMDQLVTELKQVEQEEAMRKELDINRFELRIQALMQHGARNREMAIRWLDEAYETNGNTEYLEWNLGLPYGYLTKKVVA